MSVQFNAQLHVGVKLLCFKGHQVKMLVDRHKSVRITRDELQEMIDAWMVRGLELRWRGSGDAERVQQ